MLQTTTITKTNYDRLNYENKIDNNIVYEIVETENEEIFPYIIIKNQYDIYKTPFQFILVRGWNSNNVRNNYRRT